MLRDRIWGFFTSLETAKRSVKENWGGVFDEAGYYNGAVIEEVAEGYFSYSKKRWFYKHGERKKDGESKLIRMKEPIYFKQIVGITMG